MIWVLLQDMNHVLHSRAGRLFGDSAESHGPSPLGEKNTPSPNIQNSVGHHLRFVDPLQVPRELRVAALPRAMATQPQVLNFLDVHQDLGLLQPGQGQSPIPQLLSPLRAGSLPQSPNAYLGPGLNTCAQLLLVNQTIILFSAASPVSEKSPSGRSQVIRKREDPTLCAGIK